MIYKQNCALEMTENPSGMTVHPIVCLNPEPVVAQSVVCPLYHFINRFPNLLEENHISIVPTDDYNLSVL